jgi:hypothetical protein
VSVILLFLLALIAAGAIVYPLLPGRRAAQAVPAIADKDIEQAVRRLRSTLSLHTGQAASAVVQSRGTPGQAKGGQAQGPAPTVGVQAGAPRCPACGRAYRPGDQFCVGCGAALRTSRLPSAVAQVAWAGAECPSCGATYREGDRFCARCGEPRTTEESR